MDFDFGGWATRNGLRCSDGRTIMKDAFKANDGKRVPLVWNHRHDNPECVLGHAMLENRKDGVYAYCKFNSTPKGQDAKIQVEHGDITALSIFANGLTEEGKKVLHGDIKEVSLVLAGANPGAYIDSIIMHADGTCDEDRNQGIIYTGEEIELIHSNSEEEDSDDDEDSETEETIGEIFNTLTDKQKVVVYAMLEEAANGKYNEDEESDNNHEEENTMKHNIFDKETEKNENVIAHSDIQGIIANAKNPNYGTLKTAIAGYLAEHDELAHSDVGSVTESTFYESLFPDAQELRPGAPEVVQEDQAWVNQILNRAHKSPMSRVRTRQIDIRDISKLRAGGYKKGTQKKLRGDPKLVHRTTDPQTVFVRSDLNRDDEVDITEFDVIQYMYGIDETNLREELATAIVLGDGRTDDDAQKIHPEHIRPIWTDNELYCLHEDVDFAAMKTKLQGTDTGKHFGDNFVMTEAIIETLTMARKNYHGSGAPILICSTDMLNQMLLSRDFNGRRIYDTTEDIKKALNVREIVDTTKLDNQIRATSDGKKKKLLAIYVDMSDYNIGATKKGKLTHFTGFDINFNMHQSLLETRLSGALTRIASAICLEEDVTEDKTAVPTAGDEVA